MLTDLQRMDESTSLLHDEVSAATDNEKSLECDEDEISKTPEVGMEFESEEDAYQFYNAFGRMTGFSVRREYANKNGTTKEITSRKFVCCKEGVRGHDKRDVNVKSPRAETRTGCAAHMKISLDRQKGKYRVFAFERQHNHELHIRVCSRMMPSQRKISDCQHSLNGLGDDLGLIPKGSPDFLSRQADGGPSAGYLLKDHKNYLQSKRKRSMEYGEVGSLLMYFQQQTRENPSFYYALQLDVEEKITNIFWADARMIMDYNHFGDAILFDTTYRTNNGCQPLALFAGFNHHRETVIFGASLLYDESDISFEWLFEQFLKAMSEKKPKTIFTDQDPSISKALSSVMPGTYHGLCTWHLCQNAMKNVGNVLDGEQSFLEDLKACMYQYETVDELHKAWEYMLDRYNIRDSTWMQYSFGMKEKWAKAYMKRTFSAGMRSTEAAESLNADLRNYLKANLDIPRFFNHFESVVNDKRYKELEAEYNARQKLPMLKLKWSPILNQAAKIYTPRIFEEFQNEYDISHSACIKSTSNNHGTTELIVELLGEIGEYKVSIPTEQIIACSCGKFKTFGILCSHALKVLDFYDQKLVPDQYILKRWTRDARDVIVQDISGRETQLDIKSQVTARYRMLCESLIRLASRSAESEKSFRLVFKTASELSKEVAEIIKSEPTAHQDVESNAIFPKTPAASEVDLGSGTVAAGLKRKEKASKGSKRFKSWLENLPKRRKTWLSRRKKIVSETSVQQMDASSVNIVDQSMDQSNLVYKNKFQPFPCNNNILNKTGC